MVRFNPNIADVPQSAPITQRNPSTSKDLGLIAGDQDQILLFPDPQAYFEPMALSAISAISAVK